MNLRIKKKHERAKLELEISSKLSQLTQLNLEIEAVNQQIEMAKRALKGKKATLEQLKQVNLAFNPVEGIQQSQKDYVGKPQYDEDITINDSQYGAIIKKYHDYIDKGWIKESSILDKYEAAQWFKENVMSKEEMEEAIEQADEWVAKRTAAHEKYMEDLKAGRLYDFGF